MIPRIIHQIWFGPKAVPIWTQSWQNQKGWGYRFWTEQDVVPLPNLQHEFERAKGFYAFQSDIARLEILYRYGGLYLDCDCVSLRPLPLDLFRDDDRFCPIYESEENWPGLIANGIMAAEPHCPTVGFLIKHLRGVTLPKQDIHSPWKTGPIWMTKILNRKKYKSLNLPIRIMPSILFLPEWQKTTVILPTATQYPHSLAFHFWGSVNPHVHAYSEPISL